MILISVPIYWTRVLRYQHMLNKPWCSLPIVLNTTPLSLHLESESCSQHSQKPEAIGNQLKCYEVENMFAILGIVSILKCNKNNFVCKSEDTWDGGWNCWFVQKYISFNSHSLYFLSFKIFNLHLCIYLFIIYISWK